MNSKIVSLFILRWTGFLMIPLTTLYNEYAYRPKLTKIEQKTIWLYSSTPTKVSRNKYALNYNNFAQKIIMRNAHKHFQSTESRVNVLLASQLYMCHD